MTDVRRPLAPTTLQARSSASRSPSPTGATSPRPTTVGRAQSITPPPAQTARLVNAALSKADYRSQPQAFERTSTQAPRSAPMQPQQSRSFRAPASSERRSPAGYRAPSLDEGHFELELDVHVLDKAHRADRRELSRHKDAQRNALRESFRDYEDDFSEEDMPRRRR